MYFLCTSAGGTDPLRIRMHLLSMAQAFFKSQKVLYQIFPVCQCLLEYFFQNP